jgi:serine/threonine-protein kinase
MELLPGPTLSKLAHADGPFSVGSALDAMEQAANGLQAAHAKGVMHCDIKPSNLMFDEHGNVKVLDFGIAKFNDPSRTSSRTLAGALPYIAPERLKGKPASVSGDLYSLGCVLFELLTGRPPFDGTPAQIVTKVVDDNLVADPPSLRRPDVPVAVDQLTGSLLAKNPAHRYPKTARELALQLSALRTNEPKHWMEARTQVVAEEPTLVETREYLSGSGSKQSRASRMGNRRKQGGRRVGGWVIGAVLGVAAVLALTWMIYSTAPINTQRSAGPGPETPSSKPSPTTTSTPTVHSPSSTPTKNSPSSTPADQTSSPPTRAPQTYDVTYDELEGSSKSYRSFPVGGVPFIYAAGTSAGTSNTFSSTTCSRLTLRAAIPDKNDDSRGILQVSQGEPSPVEIPVTRGQVAKRVIKLAAGEPLIITPLGSSIWWNGELRCYTPNGR